MMLKKPIIVFVFKMINNVALTHKFLLFTSVIGFQVPSSFEIEE